MKQFETVNCQLCQLTCKGNQGLTKHLQQKHNIVDLKSYYLKYLTTETSFKCPYCENKKVFRGLTYGFSPVCSNKSCLGKYMDSFRKNRNAAREKHYGDYTCQICKKEFDKLESLQSHLFKSSHPENSCHKGTITAKDYYIKFLMPKDTNIKCPICKINDRHFNSMMNGFTSTCKQKQCIGSYGNSIRPPTIPEPKVFKDAIECQICHKFFERNKGLASHISQQTKDHPTKEQYYLTYLHPETSSLCQYCKINKKHFMDLHKGYTDTCCEIDCISESIFQTKVKNQSFLGNGYSKFPIENIFDPVIDQLNLNRGRCRHAKLNKEFIHYVGNLKQFAKRGINAISYDFAYLENDLRTPLLICEFHGSCFHLRKEEAWSRRKEKDFFGNRLYYQYIKDILKEKYIRKKYPNCQYIIIWENGNFKEDLKNFLNKLKECIDKDIFSTSNI